MKNSPKNQIFSAIFCLFVAGCGGGGGETGSPTIVTSQETPVAQNRFEVSSLFAFEPAAATGSIEPATPAAPLDFENVDLAPSAKFLLASPTHLLASNSPPGNGRMRTLSAGFSSPTIYTPHEIRSAYNLPSLQKASPAELGSGQTIYIVVAHHSPNLAADLAEFNTRFGLPACEVSTLAADTPLPLPDAAPDRCQVLIARSSAHKLSDPQEPISLVAQTPSYDETWAIEASMDIQWAHAIAPMARIVVLESQTAGFTHLLGAVRLANQMGPGVVSMSWGGSGFKNLMKYEGIFNAKGMTYVAASGDNGSGTAWPAESPSVISVGGTSLHFNATAGTRTETAWSGSGGDVSPFAPTPQYQQLLRITGKAVSGRTTADVSFNADPYTGQYVAFTPDVPGADRVWLSGGGTSIGSPQWAGIFAASRALRKAQGLPASVRYTDLIYRSQVKKDAPSPKAFFDIQEGTNGQCPTCKASAGYDIPTGWGSPSAKEFFQTAATSHGLAAVPLELKSGSHDQPYQNQLSSFDPLHAGLRYSTVSGPSGLQVTSGGAISWPYPLPGSHTVTFKVTADSGLEAQVSVALRIF